MLPFRRNFLNEQPKKTFFQKVTNQSAKMLFFGALGSLVLIFIVIVVSTKVWDYSNSPSFCGTQCHTMPPEYAAYQASLHAQVKCVDCHIGKASTLKAIGMKMSHSSHLRKFIFGYDRPIRIKSMRPAKESCERCHWPEAFHNDTLRDKKHYAEDFSNTESTSFLAMRTGGGAKREGRGKGIHWHIENEVWFIASDKQKQNIPWVKTVDTEGNVTEYMDETADITPEFIAESKKHKMDCLDCHNRAAHLFRSPERGMDQAISLKRISRRIPFIKKKGSEVLRTSYKSIEEGTKAIGALENYYRDNHPGFYNENQELVKDALSEIKKIFRETVFPDMEVGWRTYEDNIGHTEFPGCFRCHNGKHFNAKGDSIRLHCNICHSVPIIKDAEEITPSEIGKVVLTANEPPSHLKANFIADHRFQADVSCGTCHWPLTFGRDDGNFCSNKACHGTKWPMVNLDARVNHPIERIGKHAEVWCHKCHQGERKPEYVCSNCHKPPKPAHYGPDCSQCHSPVGWKESAASVMGGKKTMPMPHGLEGREDCLICHGEGKFKAFPDDHKGRSNNQCLGCHKKSEKTAQAAKAEDKTSPSGSACISCHTSPGKLIKLTREIEASRPKVEKSAESEGEG